MIQECFVCAQCFRPFPDGVFYEFEGRKYCEHDFHVLFAQCCGRCGEFIVGRVLKGVFILVKCWSRNIGHFADQLKNLQNVK